MSDAKKVLIVGGVAGGASCAARMRRLDETAQITMVERGPYVSFANCGLPYHISGTIADRAALFVTPPERFNSRFDIAVKVRTEVTAISPATRRASLRDLATGATTELEYDYLLLSPGAEPIRPPLPGVDLPGVHVLRNVPDLDRIMVELKRGDVGSVVVVGAGFIGIETAENLRERGVGVTLVEKAGQVMPMLDPEMAAMLHEELEARGIDVLIGTGLAGIEATENGLRVRLDDGGVVDTQMVILSIGVKPELQLARAAGLTIGEQGGIVVDAQMRTSDPRIFAVGDAVEILNRVTGRTQRIALAGPANRQGRLVADVIAGRDVRYPGALGTSIVKVFGLAAASTGLTEQQARRAGVEYEVAWVHGSSHASYYPGAKPMTLKALFAPRDGRLLGAQAVGAEGVDKRMDVLATALYAGQTMFDLEWLDLSYAPPYSSAKDPVNQLATVAAGMLRGDHPSVRWYDVDDRIAAGAQVIDVRSAPEVASLGTLPGAINVPIDELRSRLPEIPRDRDLLLLCEAGLRGYIAGRALSQRGYRVWNVLGGHKLYRAAARSSSRRRVG